MLKDEKLTKFEIWEQAFQDESSDHALPSRVKAFRPRTKALVFTAKCRVDWYKCGGP